MGKVYYDMGFLATAGIIECSASDLVGQFVGQTGPQTQNKLEKALGKVLFIDEAYRLGEGQFAKEAMDEIVDSLTKPKFAGKLITILAGYDDDINRLMSINPGLTSRFPEAVVFNSLSPSECLELLAKELKQKKHLDCQLLTNPTEECLDEILAKFTILSGLANWANARDVQTLSKGIFGKIILSVEPHAKSMIVTEEVVFAELDSMISERSQRAREVQKSPIAPGLQQDLPVRTSDRGPRSKPTASTTTIHKTEKARHPPRPPAVVEETAGEEKRDSGVSDAIWAQLQQDKRAAAAREKAYQDLLAEQQAQREADAESSRREKAEQEALQKRIADSAAAEANEARRRFEQARIEHERARRKREEELAEMDRKRKEEEERKRKEVEAQTKLRHMGVCPVGYRWVKQSGGYRCAGGSHFVDDAQLGM